MVTLIITIFVFEYIRPGMLFPPLKVIPVFIIPVGAYFYSLTVAGKTGHRFFDSKESKYLMIFLLMIFAAMITAPLMKIDYRHVDKKFQAVLGYLLLYYLLSKELNTEKRIYTFLYAFIFIHVTLVFLNFDLFLAGDRGQTITSGSFLGDGNDFSLALNLALPMALFLVFNSRSQVMKIVMIACSGLLGLGIIGVVSGS